MWRTQVPGMRKWLKFERSGRTEILQVDKHAIALQTGVQVTNLNATSYTLTSRAAPMPASHPIVGAS